MFYVMLRKMRKEKEKLKKIADALGKDGENIYRKYSLIRRGLHNWMKENNP